MCAEAGDYISKPKETISNAAAAIRMAKEYLNKAVEATHGYDPEAVKQIGIDFGPIDAFLTELTRARNGAGDSLPAGMAEKLRTQADALHTVSEDIKRIASDLATPPGVGGYMEQSVTFIAQAAAFIRGLP